MRKIITMAGAVAAAGLFLAAPAAHAAVPAASAGCNAAVAKANKAETAYQAALADYNKQIKNGGHPGKAEQDNLANLQNAANLATSDASRDCPVTPVGPVHTGIGSTSEGTNTVDLAAGAALLAAAGVGGTLVLRRRQTGRG